MLDKEIHIRFTLASVRRFFLSPLFWVPFVVLVLVVPWGGEHAPAWVQAVGSILAIIVAIAVPVLMRQRDDRARDHAQGMRLYTAIWEALSATEQLVNQDRALRETQALRANVEAGVEPQYRTALPRDKGLRVRMRDVDFFNRIMQRASSNLDDDQCARRLAIASRFRFNLSVLISVLQVRADVEADGTLLGLLTRARDTFQKDLQKLVEINPFLRDLIGS